MVRVVVERIFPNCPRYIHRMHLVTHSIYAPRADHVPPEPEWKQMDAFRDALPIQRRQNSRRERRQPSRLLLPNGLLLAMLLSVTVGLSTTITIDRHARCAQGYPARSLRGRGRPL